MPELLDPAANGQAPEPSVERVRRVAGRIVDQVERVIVGKRPVIERVLVALLSEGHVLLEDVPGIGKTMLARSIAAALGGSFQRIQFTPDLLPTDVTGALVFDPRTAEFSYRPGPIVANVVLADESNRAGPGTQAALLEAMEERHITVERERIALPRPFLVLATQNPVELEGTFPLPEAQLDRFFLRTSIGYPELADERAMLRRFQADTPLDVVESVTTPAELAELGAIVRQVRLGEAFEDYLLAIVRGTRERGPIALGASPRAALALARAARAAALREPVTLGIVAGLLLGKQLGATGGAWLAVRAGLADLPEGVGWRRLYGAGWLAGIGFTMSLVVDSLAFGEGPRLDAAKIGILAASLVAGLVGWGLLRTQPVPATTDGAPG